MKVSEMLGREGISELQMLTKHKSPTERASIISKKFSLSNYGFISLVIIYTVDYLPLETNDKAVSFSGLLTVFTYINM